MKLPKNFPTPGKLNPSAVEALTKAKAEEHARQLERQLSKLRMTKTIGGVTFESEGGGRPLRVKFQDGATAEDCLAVWHHVWKECAKLREEKAIQILNEVSRMRG